MRNVEVNFYNFTKKSIYTISIYSIKSESTLLGVLSYGYPMGMIWLSYGINSQLPYTTHHSLLNTHYSILSYHLEGISYPTAPYIY